jgi:hypothetical protein
VKKLLENEPYLDDDNQTHFSCDAMISGQGWQRGLDMFSPTLRQHLGIPFAKDIEPTSSATKWAQLEADADKTVLSRFHILCNPPSHTLLPENRTSYRLYRGIAPLDDPTILFLNHVTVSNKLFGAEAQAMWAVA